MKKLIIDNNWYIDLSDPNNCTLIYAEQKTREKQDKDKKKTGETEEYIAETPYYYPSVQLCLKRYLQESQKEATTVEECIKLTNDSMKLIKSLKF